MGAPRTTLQLEPPNAALLDKVESSKLADPAIANAVEAAAMIPRIESESQSRHTHTPKREE
jgi:hypothetical protein